LKEKIKKIIAEYVSDVLSGKRENIASTLPPGPCHEGIDYYLENGMMVFTEWHLLKRGDCCGNACRHCPYNYKNVPSE
jgi:hypothetical protein